MSFLGRNQTGTGPRQCSKTSRGPAGTWQFKQQYWHPLHCAETSYNILWCIRQLLGPVYVHLLFVSDSNSQTDQYKAQCSCKHFRQFSTTEKYQIPQLSTTQIMHFSRDFHVQYLHVSQHCKQYLVTQMLVAVSKFTIPENVLKLITNWLKMLYGLTKK